MSGVLRQDNSVSGSLRQGYLSVWCLEAGIPQCLEA